MKLKNSLSSILLIFSLLLLSITLTGCHEKKDKTCEGKNAVFCLFLLMSATNTAPTASYSIGGSITGLTTSGLVLQNNNGDDLTVEANATTFTFPTKVTGAYKVTVKTQPKSLSCTVSNGEGTATADVTNISVSCIVLGSQWTARKLPKSDYWISVAYGDGVFITVANDSDKAATSP